MVRFFCCFLFASCSIATAQVKSIKLFDVPADWKGPVSHSVAINSKKPQNILVCTAGQMWYSLDGGNVWMKSALENGVGLNGTEVVGSDAKGNFFMARKLTQQNGSEKGGLLIQKSSDEGASWSEGEWISEEPADAVSQIALTIPPRKDNMCVSWQRSGTIGSADCQTNVWLSTSSGGKKWSKPVQLNSQVGTCANADTMVGGASPCIGPDGKIFVTWINGESVFIDRSFDNGGLWLRSDLPVATVRGGAGREVPGFGNLIDLPTLAADNSTSRTSGSINLVYSAQGSGPGESDVWFVRSLNRGDNWTSPSRVNQDGPGRLQFLPKIVVDPFTGLVSIVYYDRRAYGDNQTDVYVSFSEDGGNSFKDKLISGSPFTPTEAGIPSQGSTAIAGFKDVIVPVWTRLENGGVSIWAAVIKREELLKKD